MEISVSSEPFTPYDIGDSATTISPFNEPALTTDSTDSSDSDEEGSLTISCICVDDGVAGGIEETDGEGPASGDPFVTAADVFSFCSGTAGAVGTDD